MGAGVGQDRRDAESQKGEGRWEIANEVQRMACRQTPLRRIRIGKLSMGNRVAVVCAHS